MSEKLYARDVYGKTLVELGKLDPNVVVLDADLSGSTRTSFFAKEFPERFFNFGVAEQGMMATAGGLASSGKIVFASTFAMFATARALDQVRNTICYNKLNVKIVATHSGVTVGEDGASHQALEDISFFRSIPNMRIIVPCDGPEARSAILTAHKEEGPFYIRLGRSKIPTLESKKEFSLGKGYIVKEGSDLVIIACGILVNEAMQAAKTLDEKGISTAVVNIHTIKPIDVQLIEDLSKRFSKILVCEEHQKIGGLFSAVAEVVVGSNPVLMESISVNDKFGQSGPPGELIDFYGLSANSIAEKAAKFIRQ